MMDRKRLSRRRLDSWPVGLVMMFMPAVGARPGSNGATGRFSRASGAGVARRRYRRGPGDHRRRGRHRPHRRISRRVDGPAACGGRSNLDSHDHHRGHDRRRDALCGRRRHDGCPENLARPERRILFDGSRAGAGRPTIRICGNEMMLNRVVDTVRYWCWRRCPWKPPSPLRARV